MATGFKFTYGGSPSTIYDFDDLFVRKDLFTSGNLWVWGFNTYGVLGDSTTNDKSSPIQTTAGGTNWKRTAGGQFHSVGLKTDGTLWTWGRNATYGQLGDNTTANKSSPIQTITGGTDWQKIASGSNHVATIKTDGTLWLWGRNIEGQLGDNSQVDKSSPIQTVAGGAGWKQVSCGDDHTAAIKLDGTLWLWGQNGQGQLGDNTNVGKSSPVQEVTGSTWKAVVCGLNHTAGIKDDGTLWTWGANAFGQHGDETLTNKSSPVQTVAGGTDWKQVSSKWHFISAVKTDGTLWSWGQNTYGQMGDNTVTHKSSPVQTVAGGSDWRYVNCGGDNTLAIKQDGTLWLWGENIYGQLGDNTSGTGAHKSSPVQTVASGTDWKTANFGRYHVLAVIESSV